MTEKYLVEPDVNFINEVIGLGGGDVKKCYQCATCGVVCPISPDNKPFPRKEMVATSWGLKEKLVGSADIWLCHNCGDCSTMCPRGAKPGDVLAAVRSYAIREYAQPKFFADMANDPKKLPQLLGLSAAVIFVVGMILNIFGLDMFHLIPGGDEIVHSHFVHHAMVDIIMVPTFFFAIGVFVLGLFRFVNDIHRDALANGKTDKPKIDPKAFLDALIRVIPEIFKHKKFAECGENEERAVSHMMVFYGFAALFIVTNVFFFTLYVLQVHGPYSQLNPFKWLANVGGVALVIGATLMIKERLAKTADQVSSYKDWYVIGLALALGVTGMLTEMTRLGEAAGLSYFMYYLHLMAIWIFFVTLPFTKFAHIVYRTVAMAYAEYAERK